MTLRHLTLHVDGDDGLQARTAVASMLAKRNGASISGVFVVHLPDVPPFIAAEVGPELQQQFLDSAREQEVQLRTGFVDTMQREGIAYEWLSREGGMITEMVRAARTTDLTVVSQEEDGTSGFGILPDSMVLESGRPVIVVPNIAAPKTIGKRILVAWNGSREAARAVNDAMALLETAEVVNLVSMVEDNGRTEQAEDSAIESHLARHEIQIEHSHYRPSDIDAGEMLLSRAADTGSDLIIMGAYGHSRLREWILGGATRSVLEHMTVPVFMSH